MKKTLEEMRDELCKDRQSGKEDHKDSYINGVLDMYNVVKKNNEKDK